MGVYIYISLCPSIYIYIFYPPTTAVLSDAITGSFAGGDPGRGRPKQQQQSQGQVEERQHTARASRCHSDDGASFSALVQPLFPRGLRGGRAGPLHPQVGIVVVVLLLLLRKAKR